METIEADIRPVLVTDMSMDDYQNADGISRSKALAYETSPEIYYGRFVAGTLEPLSYSMCMRFGNCIDDALMTGVAPSGELPAGIVQLPSDIKARNLKHSKYRDFVENLPHEVDPETGIWNQKQVDEYLKPSENFDDIMTQVLDHKKARNIIEHPARVNQPSYFVDDSKSRPDILIPSMATVDIKTSVDVTAYHTAKQCKKFGVDIQMAMAQFAESKVSGEVLPQIIICIQSKPPWQVEVYSLDPDDQEETIIDVGWRRFEAARDGIRSERWRTDTHGTIVNLRPAGKYQDKEAA